MSKTGETMELNEAVARKVLNLVDAGLVRGMGEQVPGRMCVEAAVCFALGLPHADNPPCVGSAVRSYKIRLNDAQWSSDQARAKGMRRVAIAQLGSNEIDQRAFAEYVAIECCKRIVPIALRAAASLAREPRKSAISATIAACEAATDRKSAQAAAEKAKTVCRAAAAAAAYAADDAAAYAAYAADDAAAAAHAADAAAAAAYAAYADAYAAAAAHAAHAAAAAADDADARDKTLSLAAEIAVEALQAQNCAGCEWLWLTD